MELLDTDELLVALEVAVTDFDAVDITALEYQAAMKIRELNSRIDRAISIINKCSKLKPDELTDKLLTDCAQLVDAYDGLDLAVRDLRKLTKST